MPLAAQNSFKAVPTRSRAGCILCRGRRKFPHKCSSTHEVNFGNEASIEQQNGGRRDVVHQRLSRRGLLTVRVATADAAIKLLDIKTLGGLSVEASIPTALLKNEGKIRTVPYRDTDQQIFEKLRHLGVVSVRRQYSLRKTEDGSVVRGPRGVIVLTFKEDVSLPTRVMLGDFSYPVEEYLEPPLQCHNCMRYGHCYKVCRGTVRCRKCAGPHRIKECTVKEMRCANCYGPHRATYPGCPKRRDAAFAQRIRKFRIEEELAE
ncbi:hypothetical protein HPB52_008670 [Rhipicephalus sanguineus]|uniref:Gag-like protein n=1 Tax=Rhipicephalus sanguineus TaxID=34632 RepID=A0A9D4QD65_RHISA|nr:hypothetical protein HPB52_008670 [Rhipicephalus sanguineus]